MKTQFYIGAIALAVLASCGSESGTETNASGGDQTEQMNQGQEGHEGHDHAKESKSESKGGASSEEVSAEYQKFMGTYEAKRDCKGCDNAKRQITLSDDMTYMLVTKYADSSIPDVVESGMYKWLSEDDGSLVLGPDSKSPQRFKTDGDVMKSYDSESEFSVLKRVKNTMVLGQNKWILESMNGKEINPNKDNSKVVLFFGEDGTARGNAGCNSFNGSYANSEADGTIKFGHLAMTKKMCGFMGVEDEFVKTLPTLNNYVVRGDELHLYHDRDASAMVFVPLK